MTPVILPETDDPNDLGQGPGPDTTARFVLAPLRLWNDIVTVLDNGLKRSKPMIGNEERAQSVRRSLHK